MHPALIVLLDDVCMQGWDVESLFFVGLPTPALENLALQTLDSGPTPTPGPKSYSDSNSRTCVTY